MLSRRLFLKISAGVAGALAAGLGGAKGVAFGRQLEAFPDEADLISILHEQDGGLQYEYLPGSNLLEWILLESDLVHTSVYARSLRHHNLTLSAFYAAQSSIIRALRSGVNVWVHPGKKLDTEVSRHAVPNFLSLVGGGDSPSIMCDDGQQYNGCVFRKDEVLRIWPRATFKRRWVSRKARKEVYDTYCREYGENQAVTKVVIPTRYKPSELWNGVPKLK